MLLSSAATPGPSWSTSWSSGLPTCRRRNLPCGAVPTPGASCRAAVIRPYTVNARSEPASPRGDRSPRPVTTEPGLGHRPSPPAPVRLGGAGDPARGAPRHHRIP